MRMSVVLNTLKPIVKMCFTALHTYVTECFEHIYIHMSIDYFAA